MPFFYFPSITLKFTYILLSLYLKQWVDVGKYGGP